MSSSELQCAFNFTDADLIHNQRGTLSPSQRERLKSNLAIAGLISMVVGIALVSSLSLVHDFSYLIVMGFLLGGAILFLTLMNVFNTYRDLENDTVEWLEDGINLYRTGKYGLVCWARIENLEFRISRHQFDTLRSGHSYRFFYTPHSRTVVAVEEIERKT